jgi:hypothetical protein
MHLAGLDRILWLRARMLKQLDRLGLVGRPWSSGRRAAGLDEGVAQHGQEVREVIPGARSLRGLFSTRANASCRRSSASWGDARYGRDESFTLATEYVSRVLVDAGDPRSVTGR